MTTYQGGQSMPALGGTTTSTPSPIQMNIGGQMVTAQPNASWTPASQTAALSGGWALSPSSNVGSQISSANNTTGGSTQTPVVSSNSAQSDYNTKWAAYQSALQNMNQQADAVQKQQLQTQATKAQNDLQQSQQNLQQQGINIQKAQADAQLATSQAKLNASQALNAPTTPTQTPTQTSTQTPTTPQPTNQTQPTTPINAPTTQPPSTNPQDALSPSQNTLSYAQQILGTQDERTTALNSFLQTANSMVIGLQSSEASLVNATTQQFQNIINAQQQANASQVGQATEAAARSGQEYSPTQAGSTIASVINQGNQRLSEINSNMATSIANLQMNFAKQEYSMLNDNFAKLDQNFQDRMTALKDVHDAVATDAQQQQSYAMDLAKFNQSQTQFATTTSLDQQKLALSKQTEAFNEHYKIEQLKMQQAGTIDSNGNVVQRNPVTLGADGKPDPTSQAAFLATLPPMTASQVQGLANYTISPTSFSSRPSATSGQPSQATMVALAQQYDPSYNQANYQTIQQVNKDYTSGTTANNIKSFNTSINHVGDLSKNFVNLPNTDITKYNTIADWFSANKGSGDVTKVVTDLNAVTGELAKTFKGTGATDQEISSIEKGISVNSSPAQFKAFVEEAMNLLGGRVNALDESYSTATGGKSYADTHGGQTLLNPTAINVLSGLKNNGYGINVPGVNYTDASSYVKYDPQGVKYLQEAITKNPNLSQADALQQAQYNESLSQ